MMDYYVNSSSLMSAFPVPSSVADNYLKFTKPEHFKVLIFVMRNMAQEIEIEDIVSATDLSDYDVKEALLYWADAGVLCAKNSGVDHKKKSAEKTALKQSEKPTRNDVAKRGNEDPKIRFLLRDAQIKLGRNLKTNESNTFVWLYDDLGLDVSLILLIIQYAVAHKKANIRFIESVAVEWVEKGIDNIEDADKELRLMAIGEQAWGVVSSCFGIERRKPSKKETDYSVKWIEEWKMSREMLTAAYEECVNQKSKFLFPYVVKIIENWHDSGFTKPEDIVKDAPKNDDGGIAAYDIDLFEKMVNSKE